MNMNINNNKEHLSQTKKTSFFLFFIIYIVFVFGIHFYYEEKLYRVNLGFFENLKDCSSCDTLSSVGFFMSFLTDIHVTFIMTSILYVFVNIYKTFVFLSVVYACNFLRGILSLIFKGKRPFWEVTPYNEDKLFVCHKNWGTPSNTALTSIAIYLTFFKIIFSTSEMRVKKKSRSITLIFLLTLVALIDLSGFFQVNESIDQIIFGLSLGFGVFFFFFYVLCIDLTNPEEFYNFLQIRTWKILVANLVVYTISLLLYVLDPFYLKLRTEIKTNINFYKQCKNIEEAKELDDYSFLVIAGTIGHLGLILGMKADLYLNLKNNKEAWLDLNFVKPKNENESLLSEMSFSKDAQWNHTNGFVAFLRLLLTSMTIIVFFIPTILIEDRDFILSLFCKTLFPTFMYAFFLMYPFKIILAKMYLTNPRYNYELKPVFIAKPEQEVLLN